MVSALFRDTIKTSKALSNNDHATITTNTYRPIGSEQCSSALREFVNSNADLPTLEELVKKSNTLAQIIGPAKYI